MVTRTPRILLAISSAISALGGAMHASAFRKSLVAIDCSNLPHFYGGSSKGLWLADSATLFILAVIFGLISARPSLATRPLVILVALIPAATAILIYTFLGSFIAGHILLAIAVLAIVGGSQFPGSVVTAQTPL
jgi:hypothetical protein